MRYYTYAIVKRTYTCKTSLNFHVTFDGQIIHLWQYFFLPFFTTHPPIIGRIACNCIMMHTAIKRTNKSYVQKRFIKKTDNKDLGKDCSAD
jgi:hypothetical protein